MGFENARDSFVDLLQIKQEKEDREGHQDGKLLKDTSAKPPTKRTSFRLRKHDGDGVAAAVAAGKDQGGYVDQQSSTQEQDFSSYDDLCYEPCEVEEEDDEHWPLWEMMGDPSQQDSGHDEAIKATASAESGLSVGSTSSIYDCERIFTVPEVYDEIMAQKQPMRMSSIILRDDLDGNGTEKGPCANLFDCFSPWKQQAGYVNVQDHLSPSNSFSSALSHEEEEVRLNPKGVMKRSSMAVQLYLGMPVSARQSFTPSMFKLNLDEKAEGHEGAGSSKRRTSMVGYDHNNLFTAGMNGDGDPKDPTKVDKKKFKVHFSELKRVLKIRKFNPEEALDVWFQREDFDYFKNEMTLLIQEDGTSRELAEAWLEANEVENRRASSISEEEGDEASGSSKQVKSWWHNYDHSRRGLERYASPGQAREILASNKVAIQKVLGEQHRQGCLGFFCVPGARDPDRIAKVYHEYTAWSRDLALAAGASDADAVRTNFDDDKRHTREYYMLKQVVASGYKVHKHMPKFMLPKCITPKGFLDEEDSLYIDDREGRGRAGAHNLLQSLMTRQSGEEAREEMSRLGSKDLSGPLPPALLPSLQVNEGAKSKSPSSVAQTKPEPVKQQSMAAKAKNYPFQNE